MRIRADLLVVFVHARLPFVISLLILLLASPLPAADVLRQYRLPTPVNTTAAAIDLAVNPQTGDALLTWYEISRNNEPHDRVMAMFCKRKKNNVYKFGKPMLVSRDGDYNGDPHVVYHPEHKQFALIWEMQDGVTYDAFVKGVRFTAKGRMIGSPIPLTAPDYAGNGSRIAPHGEGWRLIATSPFPTIGKGIYCTDLAADLTPGAATFISVAAQDPITGTAFTLQPKLLEALFLADGTALVGYTRAPKVGTEYLPPRLFVSQIEPAGGAVLAENYLASNVYRMTIAPVKGSTALMTFTVQHESSQEIAYQYLKGNPIGLGPKGSRTDTSHPVADSAALPDGTVFHVSDGGGVIYCRFDKSVKGKLKLAQIFPDDYPPTSNTTVRSTGEERELLIAYYCWAGVGKVKEGLYFLLVTV